MNPEAQAELDRILKIEPENLNKDNIDFLAGRRDYLKKAQLEEYSEVLDKRDEKFKKVDKTPEKEETKKEEPKEVKEENQTSDEPETVKTTHAKSK